MLLSVVPAGSEVGSLPAPPNRPLELTSAAAVRGRCAPAFLDALAAPWRRVRQQSRPGGGSENIASWRAVLASLLLAGAVACAQAAPRPPRVASAPASGANADEAVFNLAGTVRDEETGHPLSGVLVSVDSVDRAKAVTDSAGRYRIPGVPYGTYTVSARTLGYYRERREIGVSCPVVVVDSTGTPLAGLNACGPQRATLNFYLRRGTFF